MKHFPNLKHLLVAALFQACASAPKVPQSAQQPAPEAGLEEKLDARVDESVRQEDQTALSKDPETPLPPPGSETVAPLPRAPVMGVWIDGAGLESFVALGFMQELHRSGVKFAKVVGTGWGCWMALSWANEASANQAEWQAFKWSSWAPLGMERGFLSRIRGGGADYGAFAKDLRIWLPKEKFSDLAMPADCPLLDASSMDLVSAHGLGIYRALWEEMRIPLFHKKIGSEPEESEYLSGLAAGDPRLEEYDRFADAGKNDVEFWIHLKASPSRVIAPGDRWLSTAFARRELKGESWSKTRQGRWIMRMPLFLGQNLDEKQSIDFGARRAMILRGRDLARKWMQSSWFRSNLSPAFTTPPQ